MEIWMTSRNFVIMFSCCCNSLSFLTCWQQHRGIPCQVRVGKHEPMSRNLDCCLVLGETSSSEGHKPRPGLLTEGTVEAPRHCVFLNNQPRALKTKKGKNGSKASAVSSTQQWLSIKPNGTIVSWGDPQIPLNWLVRFGVNRSPIQPLISL